MGPRSKAGGVGRGRGQEERSVPRDSLESAVFPGLLVI